MASSEELSASLLLPPVGIYWDELVRVLTAIPRKGFLQAEPYPFLLQLRRGLLASPPPGVEARLRTIQGSSYLTDSRVYYLSPRGASSVFVGRIERGCQVVLDDKTVSKRHAELRHAPEGWRVCDLEAANGTYLEGRRLPPGVPMPVRSGDLLRFSTHRTLFLDAGDIHSLALAANKLTRRQPKVEETAEIRSLIQPPREGMRLREFLRFVGSRTKEQFLEENTAHFLLQIPTEPSLEESDTELDQDLGFDATQKISHSRIIQLQRSKKVRDARIYVLAPSAGTPLSIGRSSEQKVDLVLDERTVSKCHAEIHLTSSGWHLLDLNSHNGTYLESSRIPPGVLVPLTPGQKLSFSGYRALFLAPKQIFRMAAQLKKKA